MNRKEQILSDLKQSETPLSASSLAGKYAVSRQIIVGDIALLRAYGHQILATPKGYILAKENNGLVKTIACKHTADQTREELYAIVDEGCTVVDVIVEHPVYGQLTGSLNLSSRHDVDVFIEKTMHAAPLSLLTEGIHLHTLHCPDEESYERVNAKLASLHLLYHEGNPASHL